MKIPQAIVQRSALVQQLQTRYGTHSNEVAESELVLANPPASEVSSDTFSTVASSIAAMKQEGRRQAVTERSRSEAGGRREDNQMGFKSQPTESFQNLNATQSQVQSTSSVAPAYGDQQVQSTSSVAPAYGDQFRVSRKAIPKISQMDANTTIQAKSDTSKAVHSSITQIDEMPLATAVTTELQPSQISPIEQQPLVQMKAASTASLPLSSTELIQRLPANTSLPVVSELPSSSPLLQRIKDEDVVDLGYIDFPRLGNSAQQPASPNLAQDNGYVSIQGIEANYARTNPRPENPPTALPLNTSLVRESISEVAPTVTANQPLSREITVPVIPSQHSNSSIPEVDVAQVAEQVSRILFRQLRIERERRGYGR